MSKGTVQVSTGGPGFLGILTLILITLKLMGTITWSWWFVLFPLWLPTVIILAIMAIMLFCYVAKGYWNK